MISYCPETLKFLCEATGFRIVNIRFRSGAFNFVRSMQYLLEDRGERWPRWIRRLDWLHNRMIRRTLKPFFFLIDTVRLGDTMQVVVVKAH